MRGRMMDFPLTLNSILDRARALFGKTEIVSRDPHCEIHRYTYAEFFRRSRQLARALIYAGLRPGDRVATLMWNHSGHLESYFGIPAAGGVLHPLNLRLHPQEIAFIANHAGDRFLIVDDVLLPIYEKFKDLVKFERVFVVPFGGSKAVPEGMESYEDFLVSGSGRISLSENRRKRCGGDVLHFRHYGQSEGRPLFASRAGAAFVFFRDGG